LFVTGYILVAKGERDAMRILSLNCWGGVLHDALLAYLAEEAPEVLCLQEVIESPGEGWIWAEYRDGAHMLPQRINLMAEIRAALPHHVAVFAPAAEGDLWAGDRPVRSRWGLATFVHAGLPVIGQAQGFVHGVYGADGFGDHPRSRSAHAVRLFDRRRDGAVVVAHMHGLRDPAGKHDTPERRAQAGRFLSLTCQVAQPEDCVVMCGDFNVEPDSETLRLFKAEGMRELVTEGGFAGTRTSRYRKPGKFADYMLVDHPEAVAAFDVVRSPEVSDHCPLLLTL
jgi:endonuclease/exonuclease/phosphatase family protein